MVKLKLHAKKAFKNILLIIIIIVQVFPIAWIILNSLKTNAQTIEIPPVWIFEPYLGNYHEIFFSTKFHFSKAMTNSVVVSLLSTGMAIIVGFPCAYSISRFKTGGRNLTFWLLSLRMLPPVIFMIPMYILFNQLRMLDNCISLSFLYLMINLPMVIMVLKSFIDDIPRDFEEAAMVDGCSRALVVWKIVFPITMPGVVAAAILTFLFSFNEFFFAYVFTSSEAITLPAMAAIYMTQYTWQWANLSAAVTLGMLPIMAFLILIQKNLVRGLTMGAIKG